MKRKPDRMVLALAGFVAAIRLVDDIEPAPPPDHAVVAMALAQSPERILDLHGKASIVAGKVWRRAISLSGAGGP
jgi:hypothetical protein